MLVQILDHISRHSGIFIPLGTAIKMLRNKKKWKNWIYVQWITPNKKRYFVLAQPAIIYEIADNINFITLSPRICCQLYPLWKWQTNLGHLWNKYSISSDLFIVELGPRPKKKKKKMLIC
jgi:hypothetical protein